MTKKQFPASKLESLTARILALEPKLRAIASRFGKDEMDTDDVYSEILEGILMTCEPEFSDAMIVTKAKWIALDHINAYNTYGKYVSTEEAAATGQQPNEDGIDFDIIDLSSGNPESILVEKETWTKVKRNFELLSPTLQTIIALLAKGYRPVEIAEKMDVSKSAVSQNINRIQNALINININL